MKKTVLAIIAVLFVQVGFQVYLAVERTNNEYAVLDTGDVSSPPAPRTPVAQLYPEPVFIRTDAAYATYKKASKSQATSYQTTSVVTPRRTSRSLQSAVAARFPTVTITVPPGQHLEYAAYSGHASYREPKKKGKSFPAKALSVVKKPYGWVKSLTSKLL